MLVLAELIVQRASVPQLRELLGLKDNEPIHAPKSPRQIRALQVNVLQVSQPTRKELSVAHRGRVAGVAVGGAGHELKAVSALFRR